MAEEDFLIMFNELLKDVEFGTVEMTIIAGVIDTIKVHRNFKITQLVDTKGRKSIQLK
jgi:hypothetical protein